MTRAGARAIGLVLTMLGVGMRLDSSWQATAAVVLAAGCAVGGWGLAAGAFVREDPGR